ncbi:hypothetical protein Q3G72_027790 [Acer saccharum]|nr:hypothetical protein Q3G72_027790 [Acer saccharum]
MASCIFILLISFVIMRDCLSSEAKVFMVLMDEEPVLSLKTEQVYTRSDRDAMVYKKKISVGHDIFLESLLQKDTYTKLYSYTHLLNGFAIHIKSEEVQNTLRNATGIRAIHEDVKMQKLTTHTPQYLGIPAGVWKNLGAENSGEGVVIGFIDTGINPEHPSFSNPSFRGTLKSSRFKGNCSIGERFPSTACNGKIVGAQYFARAANAYGDFNSTRDYESPFDADGHGRQVIHTASTAAGNHHVPVIVNGFNYGYASGMAPGARIAVYKALYSFGGYMSDVVAAVDQAVEDGVDIISLSVGPSAVPSGPSAFLNVLEMELLFATRAGVLVVQAAGNGGPATSSILSFSPWITSIAASATDRKYNNTIKLGNGESLSGTGLAPPTAGRVQLPIAAAADVSNITAGILAVESCQHPDAFIRSLVRGKLIICTYTFDFEYDDAAIATLAENIKTIGAAGFILRIDPDIGPMLVKGTTMTLQVPGIILNDAEASMALWEYYTSNTIRDRLGQALVFNAKARILDGRQAIYTGQAPVVASYSSRGPDVNNAHRQTADVLKPNLMAPGSSIWAAWSPSSEGDPIIKGQSFALLSGTSMSTPHIAGVAALIKHKHPKWSPAAITSAMMTTADVTDQFGSPILAQSTKALVHATPFDFGAGFINPTRAMDPGLIFNAHFRHYVKFLCAVPGVDDKSVRQAIGFGCPKKKKPWCSDLNTASITVSNLAGSRNLTRKVTNAGSANETYNVIVREPLGVEVTVKPKAFKIRGNGSRRLKIVLKATEARRAYSFGEMVLQGKKKHTIRVPIAVYVSSSIGS